MDILSFDIETIPQRTPLSATQQEEFDKKSIAVLKRKFPNKEEFSQQEKDETRGLVMATSPYLGEICCIGLYRNNDGVDGTLSITNPSEKEILLKFWKQLATFNGLFISFNGLNFDVPFILKRSMHHKIIPNNNNFVNLKRFSAWPHFDVKEVMGDYDKYASGTLKLMCDFLGVPSPKEGEIKADSVEEAYNSGKIDQIAEYCLRDVIATYNCYNIIKDYIYNPQQTK